MTLCSFLKRTGVTDATGHIFQIQRWSVHDGEGIRTTVFLKGCPLRCRWCANPESWNHTPEVLFFRNQCRGCGRCIEACAQGALTWEGDRAGFPLPSRCRGCGTCCTVCPAGARKPIGSIVEVEDVLRVVRRDSVFYRESGGGITFSGGEPFAQPEFLSRLAASCSALGIHIAVETCGIFDWKRVKDIFGFVDCVFVDIKHMDEEDHKRLTGVGNRRILDNITRLSRLDSRTIVRVPLISRVNDDERNISEMCEYLRRRTRVREVEILPYHSLGESKWAALGRACESFTAPDTARIEEVKKIIAGFGITVLEYN